MSAKEATVKKHWMGAWAAAGLLVALAAPASAQEVRKYEGKRWVWVSETAKPAEAYFVKASPGEEGAIPAMTTVGKNVVRAYYRRAAPPEMAKGHRCDEKATTVLKHVEFRHFCRVDGEEKPCPGMTKAGECMAVVK